MAAVIVGDRARLPNGYDLSMTAGVPNQMSAQFFSGRGVTFDGTGDQLTSAGPNITTAGAWSVSCWVKSTNTSTQYLLDGTATSNRVLLYLNYSGNVSHWATDDSSPTTICSSATLLDGLWHHLVITVSSGTAATGYIDGKSAGTATITSKDLSSITTLEISGSSTNSINGSLSDFKIISGTTLSAAQVLEQYQNPELLLSSGVTAGHRVAHWPLSDFDISGADNIGGLYLQDIAGSNPLLATNCGMEFSQPNIPQLGLRSSSSRVYLSGGASEEALSVAADSDINGLFNSGGTMSFWCFAFSSGGGGGGRLIDNASSGFRFAIEDVSGTTSDLALYMAFDGTSRTFQTVAKDFTFGVWQHVVITYDGSDVANRPVLYINNSAKTLTDPGDPAGTMLADGNDKIFGNNAVTGGVRCWDGVISEIAMWKTVLDADAVSVVYAGGQGFDLSSDSGNYDVSSSLKAWFNVDNPVTCTDLTGNTAGLVVADGPNIATIPEGTTEGLSTMGSLTQNRLGSAVMPMSIVADEDAGSSPGILAYAKGPNTTFDNTDFTICMWVYLSNTPSNMRYFHWVVSTGYILMKLTSDGEHSCLIEGNSGGTPNEDCTPSLDVRNAWSFVAFRKDAADDLKAFAGLVTDASLTSEAKTTNVGDFVGSSEWYLGSDNAAYRGLSGSIAMPRIWTDTALSDGQINALFESGKRILRGD